MHAPLCSGFGKHHTNEKDPKKPNKNLKPYATIDLQGIRELVDSPQQVEKPQAQWLIPSTLLSRKHKTQKDNGTFWALWVDHDKDLKKLAVVGRAVEALVDGADYEVYTSRSATKKQQKSRVIIPLKTPLNGTEWKLCQEIFNESMDASGITPDPANLGTGQVCYLPNEGEYYDSISRRTGELFDPLNAFKNQLEAKQLVLVIEQKKAQEKAVKRKANIQYKKGGLIQVFNDAFAVEEILTQAGYAQRGATFIHPLSESGSYSASVKDGRVHALSSNDPLFTGGEGGGAHDAFSAFQILFHDGNRDEALKDAGSQWVMINGESWNAVKQREFMQSKEPEFPVHSVTLDSSDPEDVKRLRKEIKLENTAKLSELNKNYSLVILGGVAKVMQHNSENEYDTMSVDAFKTLLCNEFVLSGTAEKPTYKPLGREWIGWRDRLTYKEGVCFEPYSIVMPKFINPHKLNLWTGFPYDPIKHDDRINVIIDYIKEIVCDNNAEYFDYLIKWMARGFQQPEKQAEVAVVLRGSKGSGKGTLGRLLKKMWGIHAKHITSTDHLVGKFNAHLKNCGYLFADEAFFAGDKAGGAALQTLITEPTMMVEFKGVDAIESKNCLKILMASNKDWVVPSSKDERRYFCLDIEEVERDYAFQTKTAYFDQLNKATKDKTTMSMFMDYMLTIDLTDFDIRTYPETTANKAQRIASLDIIPRFLLEACERGYITTERFENFKWHEKVTAEVIAKGLAEWGKDNFKSSYDRQTLMGIKTYLSKTLGLKSRAHRGMTCIDQGNVVLHPKIKGGYDLGTADILKNHIISVEKLPEDTTLG